MRLLEDLLMIYLQILVNAARLDSWIEKLRNPINQNQRLTQTY
jgi:hypothetical protein